MATTQATPQIEPKSEVLPLEAYKSGLDLDKGTVVTLN